MNLRDWVAVVSLSLLAIVGALYATGYLQFGSEQVADNSLDNNDPAGKAPASPNSLSLKTGNGGATTDDAVLSAWRQAVNDTPPPAGAVGWKPIEPRATGVFDCKPGETRVNPVTGKLQGCR